jgi:hypothetical protein
MAVYTYLTETVRKIINKMTIHTEKEKQLLHRALDETQRVAQAYTDTEGANYVQKGTALSNVDEEVYGTKTFHGFLEASAALRIANTTLTVEDQFYLYASNNANPAIVFDAGDSFGYDRTNDYFVMNQGYTNRLWVKADEVDINARDLTFVEKSAINVTPAAGYGYLYCKDTSPSTLVFVSDTGAETTLGSGGGASTFVGLTDTPASFATATALDLIRVNAGKTALEYVTPGYIENVVEDTTPQLGGDLDVNGNSIVSAAGGDIAITPDTTGDVILDGIKWPQADGTGGYVLSTDGAGQTSWVANSGGFTDPMTTNEDIIKQSGGVPARLGVGTNGQVLTVTGGVVGWAASAAGFADPMTTRGDVIYRDATNTTARLAVGAANYVLTSDGTDVSWAAASGGTFLSLTDAPSSYSGQASKWLRVNAGATAIEFTAAPVQSISATSPVQKSGTTSVTISMPAAAGPSTNGYMTGADKAKLDAIESLADVTDATNVAAAGAFMGDVTISTSAPSGGSNDDIWFRYV